MEEIVRFVQGCLSQFAGDRGRIQPIGKVFYAIGCELGGLLLIQENGKINLKTNSINGSQPVFYSPLDFIEMVQHKPPVTTIVINGTANISMMFCHHVCHTLDSTCRKIVLLGSCSLSFSDVKIETEADQCSDYNPYSNQTRIRQIQLYPINLYELHNGDEIEIRGAGNYYLRISSTMHCLYIDPSEYRSENIIYRSATHNADSQQNLQSFVDDLKQQEFSYY